MKKSIILKFLSICLVLTLLFGMSPIALHVKAAFETRPMVAGSVALKSDGTVWTWGDAYKDYMPVHMDGLTDVTAITSSGTLNAALKSDGTVWAWGKGPVGDGTTGYHTTPVQVSNLTNITAISAGSTHIVALKSDGTVWTWGSNYQGQLGDGTNTDRTTPVRVSDLSGVTAISAGESYTVVLKSDGTVLGWGNLFSQQLNPEKPYVNEHIPVEGLSDVTAIAAGTVHTLALKSDGTVWAWGDNCFGKLGDGTELYRDTPVRVSGLSDVTAISAGYHNSLALKSDGTVWAWGENSGHEMSKGIEQSSTPICVSGASDVAAISAKYSYSVVLKNDGTVWLWSHYLYQWGYVLDAPPAQVLGENGVGFLNLGETIPVTGVSVSPKSLVFTRGDDPEKLTATVAPANASNKVVTWSSSNQAVATVSGDGTVTAVGAGSATITATTADGSKMDTCAVEVFFEEAIDKSALNAEITLCSSIDTSVYTVESVNLFTIQLLNALFIQGYYDTTQYEVDETLRKLQNARKALVYNVPVTNVTVSSASATINEGETVTLTATVLPAGATNKTITWSSSAPSVATVKNGVVTAVSPGTAVITVTTQDGKKTATCDVMVKSLSTSVSSVTLDKSSTTLKKGDQITLKETVLPTDATDKSVSWSSSNPTVATVSSGVVEGRSSGTATITVATADGNKTAKCQVTVTPLDVAVSGVTLDKSSTTLKKGNQITLKETVLPTDATEKAVTWSSSNKSVATVTNGIVKAIAPGTSNITVTTKDGNKTAICQVTVAPLEVAVTGVTLNKTSVSLYPGSQSTLTATILPAGATNKTITWSSSAPSVATVKNGVVTTVSPGIAAITVTTQDGKKTAKCTIVVQSYVSLRVGYTKAIQNGVRTNIDNVQTKPFKISGKTMLPIRFVSEKMNAKVTYTQGKTDSTSSVRIVYGKKTVFFYLNSKSMTVTENGKTITITLDVTAQKKNGKTYVPLRAVGQALGFDVYYDAVTEIIVVNNPKMDADTKAARLLEAKAYIK